MAAQIFFGGAWLNVLNARGMGQGLAASHARQDAQSTRVSLCLWFALQICLSPHLVHPPGAGQLPPRACSIWPVFHPKTKAIKPLKQICGNGGRVWSS